MMKRLWCEDEGILTFEWILLLTLLVIGVIGGVAGIRDAIIHECQGVVGAMCALDQGYKIVPPLGIAVHSSGSGSDAANCTSSATYSVFVDDNSTDKNRLTKDQLTAIHQGVLPGTILCPVTLP